MRLWPVISWIWVVWEIGCELYFCAERAKGSVEPAGMMMAGLSRIWTAGTSVGNFIALSGEYKIFAGTDCLP